MGVILYLVGRNGIGNNFEQNTSTSIYSASSSSVISETSNEEAISQSNNKTVDFDTLHQKTQLAMLLSVFYTNADVTTLVYMSNPNEIIFNNPNMSPVRFIDDHNGIFEIYDYNSNNIWVKNGQISKKELVDRYYSSSERIQETQRVADSINMSYSSNSFIDDNDS